MQSYAVAFIALARPTFDLGLANEITQTLRQGLVEQGFTLLGPAELVSDLPGVQAASASLAGKPVDLLLVLQATFADSTLITALADAVEAPLLLWAVPEDRTGERLRLNSLCGVNLGAHALKLRQQAYHYVYASPTDSQALHKALTLAQAGKARRWLKQARLGVVGERPAGLDSCNLDTPMLEACLGLEVVPVPLERVFTDARQMPPEQVGAVRQALEQRLDNLAELEQAPLAGTLSVYAALKKVAQEEKLDGLAVRCWPEFFTQLGCAACGAMSLVSEGFLMEAPLPCSCEADANGTVTQMILGWLSQAPVFGSDLVGVDAVENSAVLWHCGLAPLSMADPEVQPRGGIHSNRRLPLVMEFPLKPGPITLARLSQTGQADQPLRLVVGSGEMLKAGPSFAGTSGVVRFNRPAQDVLDTILSHGLEHHLSFTYGDYRASLLALAEMLALPVLEL